MTRQARPAVESPPPVEQLLAGDVVSACSGLIGCVLARRLPDGSLLQVQLVELEAYHQSEPGCHAFKGLTPRTSVMFGPPGRLYVYFTYGMWHCANIVCEAEGTAAAVLLRAAAPYPAAPPDNAAAPSTAGLRLHGPGLICQSLQLDRRHSGMQILLGEPPQTEEPLPGDPAAEELGAVYLYRPPGFAPPPLSWTTRVGFSFQDTLSWRCFWTGHPAVGKVSLRPLKRKGGESLSG